MNILIIAGLALLALGICALIQQILIGRIMKDQENLVKIAESGVKINISLVNRLTRQKIEFEELIINLREEFTTIQKNLEYLESNKEDKFLEKQSEKNKSKKQKRNK